MTHKGRELATLPSCFSAQDAHFDLGKIVGAGAIFDKELETEQD
jgi:hypothetical protein